MARNRAKTGKGKKPSSAGKKKTAGQSASSSIDPPTTTTPSTDEIEEVEIFSDYSPHSPPECWTPRTMDLDAESLADFIENTHPASIVTSYPDMVKVQQEYLEILTQCQKSNVPEHSMTQLKTIIDFYEKEINKAKLAELNSPSNKASEPMELLEKLEKLDFDILNEDGSLPPDLTDETCRMIKEKLQLSNEDLEILKEFKMAMENNSFIKILAENNRLEELDQRISEKMRGITMAALTRIQQSGNNFPSTDTEEGKVELLTSDRMLDFAAEMIIDRRKERKYVREMENESFYHHVLATGCQTCREYSSKAVFQTTLAKPFCPDTMWNALLGMPSDDLKLNRQRPAAHFIRVVQLATHEDRTKRGVCDIEAVVIDFVNPEELNTYFQAVAYSLGFIHRVQMGDESDEVWHCRVQLCSKPYPWRKMDYMKMVCEMGERKDAFFDSFFEVTCPQTIEHFFDITALQKRGYERIGPVIIEEATPAAKPTVVKDPQSTVPTHSKQDNDKHIKTAAEDGDDDDILARACSELLGFSESELDYESDDEQNLTPLYK